MFQLNGPLYEDVCVLKDFVFVTVYEQRTFYICTAAKPIIIVQNFNAKIKYFVEELA